MASNVFVEPDVTAKKIEPIKDTILAYEMYFGEQTTKSGIILLDDDAKDQGIHPRWCKVYAIGPKQKYVEPEEWIFVKHGRWSRGINFREIDENGNTKRELVIRKIDPNDILMKTKDNIAPQKSCMIGPF